MTPVVTGLIVFAVVATVAHVVSAVLVALRARAANREGREFSAPPVTLVRPVCGLDEIERITLATSFDLQAPHVELIFCSARDDDPAVPYLRELMARHPDRAARLVTGGAARSVNPKLDNMAQAWPVAHRPWIIFADSNLMLPPDYVERVLARWDGGTGLVSAPPIGASPIGLWGELECAFLNTYQARWQYVADSLGFGFAQGKTLAWRRADLEAAGGVGALAAEPAEDAAATRLVRAAGRRVRLAGPSFVQPIGRRTWRQVIGRQTRWAQLRRRTFCAFFIPEVLTGGALPILATAVAADQLGASPLLSAGAVGAIWLGTEAALARAARWHLSWQSPVAWLMRDALILFIWLRGWTRSSYEWRGNAVGSIVTPPRQPISEAGYGR